MTLGFELTAMHYLQFTLALFPFFALMLLIVVWHLHKNPFKRAMAMIPLAISITMTVVTAFNALIFATQNLSQYEGLFLDAFILMTIPSWPGSNLLFLLFFFNLLYVLHLSCTNIINSSRLIGIMTLGFLSQFVLSLSPSLYGSALRTFIYASFAIIICALLLYESGAKEYIGRKTKILLAIVAFTNVVLTFAISIVRMLI